MQYFLSAMVLSVAIYLSLFYKGIPKEKRIKVISADELFSIYSLCPASGDALFTNKMIQVHGELLDVFSLDEQGYVITLKTTSQYFIQCQFAFGKLPDNFKFRRGEEIQIIGNCQGEVVDIYLTDCVLVEE